MVGVGARGTSQKFWDSYLILQPLKVATSVCGVNVTITALVPNLVVLAGLQEHLKNIVWTRYHVPYTMYHVTAAEM